MWYLINQYKLNIVAILEPLVPMDMFKYCSKFRMDKVVSNCSNKIWVFSDPDFDLEVLEDHVQFLHCKISSTKLPCTVLMTFVYAKCTRQERKDLWIAMRQLANTSLPWAVGGRFQCSGRCS